MLTSRSYSIIDGRRSVTNQYHSKNATTSQTAYLQDIVLSEFESTLERKKRGYGISTVSGLFLQSASMLSQYILISPHDSSNVSQNTFSIVCIAIILQVSDLVLLRSSGSQSTGASPMIFAFPDIVEVMLNQ